MQLLNTGTDQILHNRGLYFMFVVQLDIVTGILK